MALKKLNANIAGAGVCAAATGSSPVIRAPGHGPADLAPLSLCMLDRGVAAEIADIRAPATAYESDLVRRLMELGFVPGEKLRVVAHGQPGNEPIAVRLGGTTFALRRAEADHIRVTRKAAAAA